MSKVLLAKSEPQVTLYNHTNDGLKVCKFLSKSFPLAPKLAALSNFWELLRFAIITHDLGKSHSEFQKILRGEENNWNSQRHELFSLSFTNHLPLNENEKLFVLRVVAGHHRSFDVLRCFIRNNYEIEGEFEKEFEKIDITGACKIANDLGCKIEKEQVIPFHPKDLIINYRKLVNRVKKSSSSNNKSDFFSQILLMGAFHHCDHLSSGFITEFPRLERSSFTFLEKMKAKLKKKNLDFYKHQQEASDKPGHVILTAPTGSGKTETSMLWLKKNLEAIGQGRVFYILPFTASINAMYERLSDDKKGLGENMVGMLHGKLNAYLYENFFAEEGNLSLLKDRIKSSKEQFKNLQTPLKVLTPFQLLKHIFGLKGFEKGIFEWVGAYFIFDEIHAYDAKVTAQMIVLLEFLHEKLAAKAFVMTATLPTFLKNIIRKSLGGNQNEITANIELYNAFKRHLLKVKAGQLSDNYELIKKELSSNYESSKSVLIVCNTVDVARGVFEYFKKDYQALLLHSRFTAKDRNAIEKILREKPPQLLIGTQAIEVSLDIDYDIIFTEPAPLDALIQRFGRVNRKRQKAPCDCVVFSERSKKDQYIYDEDLIQRTLLVLREIESIDAGLIQEVELQKFIDKVYPDFSEKAKEEFQNTYNTLKEHSNNLFPFHYSKEGEEAYYSQFNGIKVVPACYEQQFKNLLTQFNFIGADLLKVSLSSNQYSRFKSQGTIKEETIVISNPLKKNTKLIKINYFKINKKYTSDTGLNFEIDEFNASINIDI